MPAVQPKPLLSTYLIQGFDGGLNMRDAETEVAPNETPYCLNVTLDERGGAEARLGLTKLNGASLLPQAPSYLYYSEVADALLAYISTDAGNGKLYKSTDGGVTWAVVTSTFTAGAQAAIIDFKTNVVLVNTLDGVYSYPSTLAAPTHTAGGTANMDIVRGSAIAVWQNKLWVTGDIREDATHSQSRVWFSDAGNEQSWTVATSFIDIRDVDTKICTAIGAGVGMDVTGKPTLLVCKEMSVYRINDSASGSYTTLHAHGAGAAGAKAIASNLGRICMVNREGVWVTDGLQIPIRVSDKLQPLFTSDGLNFGANSTWAAAPYRDRVVFNLTRAGSATPNLMLEYHPEIGWTVPHELALGPMAVYTKQTARLMGASTTTGKVYEVFAGGSDDGVAISAAYQTPWVPVANGDQGRLRYLRAFGRGSANAQLRTDFSTSGDDYALVFGGASGSAWDVGSWDSGTWGEPATEGPADVRLDQVCSHVSIVFSNVTSASSNRPPLLGDGNSPEAGAWGVFKAKLDYVQLGT